MNSLPNAFRSFSLVVATCWSAGAGGTETDAVALGHDLVEQHCSGCHAIEATGDSPLALAPPFRELHQRYDVEFLTEALVEGIATAHAEMPQFEFEPDDADAIVTYLKSLEPDRAD